MAANDSGQEKTEDATPKRLREARKKGQVPKSRDVTTIVVLIFCFGLLAFGAGWMGLQLQDLMKLTFDEVGSSGSFDQAKFISLGKASLITLAKIILPFGLVAMITAALAGFLQVGAIFSMEPLKPQLKKLNAIEGLKNMFKAQTFIELVKNIAKLIIVFYLAYSTLSGEIATVLQTTNIPVADSARITGSLLASFVIKVCLAFLAISLVDFLVQKKQFMKQMRMTKDEVKREYKQDEGDPLIKSHRRQLHREYAFGDVKQQVAASDAVVTNPVHVAVAIQYNRDEMAAPEVTVRGQRAFAEMIKQVAEENNIPIIRNVPLAWALFELEEGLEIPEDLYEPVAEILSYVYRMKQAQEQAEAKKDQIQYI
jgi:flagellar biosynthetic protein FlhB